MYSLNNTSVSLNRCVDCRLQPTPGHIAAQFLFQIGEIFDDFRGKTVLDLGTGGGQLGIGAALMGCESVSGDSSSDKSAAQLGSRG